MSDAQQGDEGQQATGSEAADETSSTEGAEGKYASLPDEVRQLLREKDAEAAKYRKQLRATESKVQQYEQQNLSEAEKRDQRIRQLEEELNETRTKAQTVALKAEVTASATQLGFRNPKVAHRLLDPDAVEYDESGNPKNVEALLKTLLRSDPYLAATGGADGGQGRETESDQSMSARIRAAAGRQ